MSAKTILLLTLGLLAVASAVQKRYDGYKVIRIGKVTEWQAKILNHLRNNPDFDFWTEIRKNGPTDVMVSPHMVNTLKGFLRKRAIPFIVKIQNVQTLIDAEQEVIARSSEPSNTISFTQYHSVNEIQSWLDDLASQYPNIVSIESVGSSYEGRDLKLIKISSGGSGKPSIMIDGGIHAREWIAPATVTYIISQLVENTENRDLVNNVDWYILPNVNPDGYEFSRADDRMWRKTRSPTNSPLDCVGADANRNFDFHWMEGGASSSPCSDTFAGPEPLSEVEAQALADYLNSHNFIAYLTFHSYGQYFLAPWGYTSDVPDDFDELIALATDAAAALEAVHGTKYTIGSSTNVLYIAAGASDDYAKGVSGVKYVYTIELRDEGRYGFVLPPNLIIPTAEETWEAVKVIGNFVATK